MQFSSSSSFTMVLFCCLQILCKMKKKGVKLPDEVSSNQVVKSWKFGGNCAKVFYVKNDNKTPYRTSQKCMHDGCIYNVYY